MYGLTPTLKNEIVTIAPKGRVNSVNPGWVATPLAEEVLKDKAFVERALATTPLQKVGTPRDCANQIAVIASPTLSGHLSGVNLQVGTSSSSSMWSSYGCTNCGRWWHGGKTIVPAERLVGFVPQPKTWKVADTALHASSAMFCNQA